MPTEGFGAFVAVHPLDFLLLVAAVFSLAVHEGLLYRRYWKKSPLRKLYKSRLGRGIITQIHLWLVASSAVYLAEAANSFFLGADVSGSQFYPLASSMVSSILPATVVLGWEAGNPAAASSVFLMTIFNLLFIANGVGRIGGGLIAPIKRIFMRGENLMDEPCYVICGGDPKALELVVEQMTNEALGGRRLPIHILVPENHAEQVEYLKDRYSDSEVKIEYAIGSMLNDSDLEKASILSARGVLVLPARLDDGAEDPDTTVVLACKAIRNLFQMKAAAVPPIVAKVDNPLFTCLLEGEADQIICSRERDYRMAAAAVFNEDLTDVYEDLLRISVDTNEVYTLQLPARWSGREYSELAAALAEADDAGENPVTLIGIKRGGELFLNPSPGRIDSLRDGDRAIVISRRCPDDILESVE